MLVIQAGSERLDRARQLQQRHVHVRSDDLTLTENAQGADSRRSAGRIGETDDRPDTTGEGAEAVGDVRYAHLSDLLRGTGVLQRDAVEVTKQVVVAKRG